MKLFSTNKFKASGTFHQKRLYSPWLTQMEGREAVQEYGVDYTVYLADGSHIYPVYDWMLIDGPEQLSIVEVEREGK